MVEQYPAKILMKFLTYIKHADFRQITRNKTLLHPVQDFSLILSTAFELLENEYSLENMIRLMGLTVLNKKMPIIRISCLQLTIGIIFFVNVTSLSYIYFSLKSYKWKH